MKKPETLIVNNIMDYLNASGGWWFKVHGEVFQALGIPDIVGCYKGRFVGIEVKRPGETPTKKQWEIINLILKAGGNAGYCTNLKDALEIRNKN